MTRITYSDPAAGPPPESVLPVTAIVAGQSHHGVYRVIGRQIEVTYRGASMHLPRGALRPHLAARLALQKLVITLGETAP